MALIERIPGKETGVRPPEMAFPVTEPPRWRAAVRWAAVGVTGVGLGAALVIGFVNTNDVDSLRSDVTSLQGSVTTLERELTQVRQDAILDRSAASLAGEHMAQAPTSLGLLNEHLAQAPD